MNQVLRDRLGNRIGEIKEEGSRLVIRDRIGNLLGYFDGKYTRDRIGNIVGIGNLLTTLLK